VWKNCPTGGAKGLSPSPHRLSMPTICGRPRETVCNGSFRKGAHWHFELLAAKRTDSDGGSGTDPLHYSSVMGGCDVRIAGST
jgi:hypothetical protein